MNVNKWFEIHAKKPIKRILGLFILLNVAFLVYAFIAGSAKQYESFKDYTVSSLIMSLQNKDRVLMEHSLEYSVEKLRAKQIYLCQGNDLIASPSRDIDNCTDIQFNKWAEKLTTFNLSSFEGYKVYIVSSVWPLKLKDLWFIPLGLILLLLVRWSVNRLQKRIAVDILGSVEKILDGREKIDIEEFEVFRQKFLALKEKNKKEKQTKEKTDSTRSLFHNLNNQVGTLEGLKKKLPMTDRQKRIFGNAIFEIKKMADKSKTDLKSSASGDVSIVDVLPMLSNIVQNKEIVSTNSGKSVSIKLENTTNIENLFCKINATEFRSVVGNLINNSLEASAKNVKVSIKNSENNSFDIYVADDGGGVPAEIRHKLFEENFTHGKEGGSGIGLYHAKKCFESWGGKVRFDSEKVSAGSTFVLNLKEFEVPEISVCDTTKILVLDDNDGDRNRLLEKLESNLPDEFGERIVSFNDYNSLAIYLDMNKEEKKILFSDYDLGENSKTGLDLIRSFSLEHLSFLVTNSYDSEKLVEQCSNENISIIPKPKLDSVRINFVGSEAV